MQKVKVCCIKGNNGITMQPKWCTTHVFRFRQLQLSCNRGRRNSCRAVSALCPENRGHGRKEQCTFLNTNRTTARLLRYFQAKLTSRHTENSKPKRRRTTTLISVTVTNTLGCTAATPHVWGTKLDPLFCSSTPKFRIHGTVSCVTYCHLDVSTIRTFSAQHIPPLSETFHYLAIPCVRRFQEKIKGYH